MNLYSLFKPKSLISKAEFRILMVCMGFIHFILISKHIASVLEAFREVAFVSVVFRLWVLLPGAGVCAFSGSAAHGATPSKRGE